MQYPLYILASLFLFLSCNTDEPDPNDGLMATLDQVGAISEGDYKKTISVTIRLSKASAETQVVLVQSVDGSAEGDVDFKSLNNFPVEFLPGDVQNELIIEIYGDEIFEEDETFSIVVVYPKNATEPQSEITITILNDDHDTSLIIPTTGFESPLTYPGLELIWSDEFDAGENLEENWTFEVGGNWHNNESQYYRKENTSIHEDGFLVIEARKENYGGREYTSSRIITRDKFEFKYGRVDIRANLPFGKGIWPALWMLGHNISEIGWPACGETDIMELIGSTPATIYGTIHWLNAGEHAQYGGSKTLSSGLFNDEFHVFSIVWNESKIQWLLDNNKFFEADITPAELNEFHIENFFIFNVAVGGDWPGYPNSTTVFPQRMIVDYIRVFQ